MMTIKRKSSNADISDIGQSTEGELLQAPFFLTPLIIQLYVFAKAETCIWRKEEGWVWSS